jgi:hypothetical protein
VENNCTCGKPAWRFELIEKFWRDRGIKPAEFLVVYAVEDFVDELTDWVEIYEIQKTVSCSDNFYLLRT